MLWVLLELLVPHHLSNDFVGGEPVAAGDTPVAAALVHAATVDGRCLTWEVAAVWRRNMIIRVLETQSLWQHATGEELAGQWVGGNRPSYRGRR